MQFIGEEDESLSLDGDDDLIFNIKYFMSSNFMSLELKDFGFCRYVLVQCLIIFDYMKIFGKVEKDGLWEGVCEEFKVYEDCVKKLLRIIFLKGREFFVFIEYIFECDKNWVWWKCDGCILFECFVQEKKIFLDFLKRRFRW